MEKDVNDIAFARVFLVNHLLYSIPIVIPSPSLPTHCYLTSCIPRLSGEGRLSVNYTQVSGNSSGSLHNRWKLACISFRNYLYEAMRIWWVFRLFASAVIVKCRIRSISITFFLFESELFWCMNFQSHPIPPSSNHFDGSIKIGKQELGRWNMQKRCLSSLENKFIKVMMIRAVQASSCFVRGTVQYCLFSYVTLLIVLLNPVGTCLVSYSPPLKCSNFFCVNPHELCIFCSDRCIHTFQSHSCITFLWPSPDHEIPF